MKFITLGRDQGKTVVEIVENGLATGITLELADAELARLGNDNAEIEPIAVPYRQRATHRLKPEPVEAEQEVVVDEDPVEAEPAESAVASAPVEAETQTTSETATGTTSSANVATAGAIPASEAA